MAQIYSALLPSGAVAFSVTHTENGAAVTSTSGSPFTVTALKTAVITGLRGGAFGSGATQGSVRVLVGGNVVAIAELPVTTAQGVEARVDFSVPILVQAGKDIDIEIFNGHAANVTEGIVFGFEYTP